MEDLFVLLGHPVAHSQSPAMHEAAFRAVGVNARYLALEAADFSAAWAAVRRLEIRGGNVTVPWKEAAVEALDRPSREALRTRSANTFWRTAEGLLAGTQTDGEGFIRALQEDFDLSPQGIQGLVLGAGGGARAVVHALADAGAATLYLWNRTADRAARLVEGVRESGFTGELVALEEPRLPPGCTAELVVNATSVGLREASEPVIDPAEIPGLRFAVDLVYGPRETPFVRACGRAGLRVTDGRGMLLHQGARAFELWFGVPAPLDAMRSALERGLDNRRAG